jgi:hypothetical protein
MLYLVDILKSMDFVERIQVEGDTPTTRPKASSFFAKYNGCMPNLDVQAFENYITETRNEFE